MKFKKAVRKAKKGKDVFRYFGSTWRRYLHVSVDGEIRTHVLDYITKKPVDAPDGVYKEDVDADTWQVDKEAP